MKKETKEKFALWAYPSTLEKVRGIYKEANCRSMSEFIEEAIEFYLGYHDSKKNQDYLARAITSTIDGIVGSAEHRNAMILFKFAVEMSMMTHVIAASFDIDKETIYKLRAHCVREVKEIHGRIGLENARKYQKEDGVTENEIEIYNRTDNGYDEDEWDEE